MTKRTDSGIPARLHALSSALPPGQRNVADYVLAHLDDAAFLGVEELAGATGTSVGTVVRFARKLGYDGFSTFRKALVDQARSRAGAENRLLGAPSDASSALHEVARLDIANIERTVRGIDEGVLREVIRRLASARARVLIGHGVSRIMSDHLAYLLTLAGVPTVSSNSAEFATQVANLGPKDVLVALTFMPYSRETRDAAAYAHKRGVPVVAFTDRLDAPLAKIADHTLLVAGQNLLFSHSLSAFSVVAHTIATSLASRDRVEAIQRLRESERVAKSLYTEA